MVFDLQEELERNLQDDFISSLISNGYEYVEINNQDDLIFNFKKQLKLFNPNVDFDFEDVYNYLSRDDGISKSEKLRNPYHGVRFIDFSDFSSNIFQVAQEVQVKGNYANRYDVTILVNGLPLVQIELKRSGVELKIAFNQIQRYENQSYHGLFEFVQVFVISNKVHTRYFFNDSNYDYSSTYIWKNSKDLASFTNSFLIPKNLISFLNTYIIKNPFSNDYLMIRPYQADILKGFINKVRNHENAYVWMSYNSGRTLVSYKLAEILKDYYQVIYIAQNSLLDYPEEYTVYDYKQFLNALNNQNLIITNINSIPRNDDNLELIKDNEFIFIFNDYEKYNVKFLPDKLMETFTNSLFYCFTPTPVFNDNIIHDRTTKTIFNNNLYIYSFKDALDDNNVLELNVEYFDDDNINEDYDLSSNVRIYEISRNIIDEFDKKSNNQHFKSILLADSNKDLIKYYYFLKDDLKIAPILRFDSNDIFMDKPVRDYFEQFIHDYNRQFDADIVHRRVVDVSRISENFEKDIIKRFKNGEIDLLLVDASMFKDKFNINILENLKNPLVNAIYIDCMLNYQELFEAFNMVNMNGEIQKTKGNIILYRNLQDNIEKTIQLYSNNHSQDNNQLKNYDYYLKKYNEYLTKIKSTDNFNNDYNQLSYYYNVLKTFSCFDLTQAQIDEFNTYKDEYDHQLMRKNESKKNIETFNPHLIKQFTINSEYIKSLENKQNTPKQVNNASNNVQNKTIHENNFNIINNNQKTIKNENQLNILKNSQKTIKNENNLNILTTNQDLSKTINVKNEYHIHIGGDTIKHNNLNLNELIINKEETVDLGKICPVCGKKYSSEYNYCSRHEELVDLVFEKDLIKYCRCCGTKYIAQYNYCRYCDCNDQLLIDVSKIETNPNKLYGINNYQNSIAQITDLLTPVNIEMIKEFNLSQKQFNSIINNIKNTYKQILAKLIEEFNINDETLNTLDKILLFAKSFVKTEYKEGGGDLGHFEFNEIYIDDRATKALQITTIIHELSHFLLAEILEQIISIILNTNKTEAIEALTCYILVHDELNNLIDEYCAHTVEGRFAALGYQDYGSYELALTNFQKQYSEEYIEVATGIGNTFATYIKDIITSYIDDNLREDIKKEFLAINDVPKYSSLKYETTEVYEWERFSRAIKLMLTSNLDEISNNPEDIEKLKTYAIKFKKNNME